VFHWDGGLRLSKADLAVDFRRRQPRAFVSHAHTDHIAPHEYALCTPETAALYQLRLGRRRTLEMPYRTPIEWGGLRLTTYPAGHCLGSAMLLAEDGERSLLYTGDFKLGESATAQRAELPRAEILVIESTFGHPDYRFPPRDQVIEQLCNQVRETLEAGGTPVVVAYALGKAQEVTRILADAGFAVLQHREIGPISEVYESFGVKLGHRGVCTGKPEPGHVLVVPPGTCHWRPASVADQHGQDARATRGEVRMAVTGWAIDARAKYRLGVDHAFPLSDHADYDELLEAVARVQPRQVYCTHGPESFVERLRDAGHDAHVLGRPSQHRLF
jgi:Cft2 family RNA processing exonuclease